jgi:hypothetical protein
MFGLTLRAQRPPEPKPVTDGVVQRFEDVYEVDPRLMERWVLQQTFPNWDTLRIMHSRHDHLAWMHRHFAERVVSGAELLAELDAEPPTGTTEASDAIQSQGGSP